MVQLVSLVWAALLATSALGAQAATAPATQPPGDIYGDPLPAGASARYGTMRLRHARHAWAAAFSADKTRLASVDGTGRLMVWDLKTGQRLWASDPRGRGPTAMAFSADGRTLACAEGPSVILRDVAGGALAATFDCPQGVPPTALLFTADGRRLVALGGTVQIWDLPDGRNERQLKGFKGAMLAGAMSPDGKLLAAGGYDAQVWVWDIALGKESRRLAIEGQPITSVAFSTDGKFLAASHRGCSRLVPDPARPGATRAQGQPPATTVWDLATGQSVRNLQDFSYPKFLPGGKSAFGASWIGGALWRLDEIDAATWQVRKTHIDLGCRWTFSQDGALVATMGPSGGLDILELPGGKPLLDLPGHHTGVGCLAFSPDGRLVVTGHGQGSYPIPTAHGGFVWDVATSRLVARVGDGKVGLMAAAFSPDGKRLAGACHDRRIRVWRVSDWSMEAEAEYSPTTAPATTPATQPAINLLAGLVRDIAWLDETRLVAEGFDGALRLIQLGQGQSRELIAATPDSRRLPTRMAVSPDRKFVLRAGAAGVALYSSEPFAKVRDLPMDGRLMIGSVTFDQGGTMAVVGNLGAVYTWDVKTGQRIHSITTRGDHASSGVAISPDRSTVAAAGARDGIVRVWRLADGALVKELSGHEGETRSVAFTPDGRYLLSGSDDCTVLRWDVSELGSPRPGEL
jgi:WD40 repeat protein